MANEVGPSVFLLARISARLPRESGRVGATHLLDLHANGAAA